MKPVTDALGNPVDLSAAFDEAQKSYRREQRREKTGNGNGKATRGKKDDVKPKLTWAIDLLSEHYKDRLRLNQFTLRQELDGRELRGVDAIAIRVWLERMTDKSFGRDVVNDAIDLVAFKQGFDSLIEYLDGLEWDGAPRLETWLSDVYGVEQSEYTAAVGRCWPISAVARAYKPGCKVRDVLLLAGIENLGKSLSLEALCPVREWFSDSLPPDLHSKDAAIGLSGRWIIESAEMASMRRSEHEAVKAFLSRNVDDFRPPYARKNEQVPRRCIFACTTNHDDVLSWGEENTRFWPIQAVEFNRDYLLFNRDQIWAEAKALYQVGAQWWITDEHIKKEAKAAREDFEAMHPWFQTIADKVSGKDTVIASDLLGFECLDIPKSSQNEIALKTVSRILKKLGFKGQTIRVNGKPTRGYKRMRV